MSSTGNYSRLSNYHVQSYDMSAVLLLIYVFVQCWQVWGHSITWWWPHGDESSLPRCHSECTTRWVSQSSWRAHAPWFIVCFADRLSSWLDAKFPCYKHDNSHRDDHIWFKYCHIQFLVSISWNRFTHSAWFRTSKLHKYNTLMLICIYKHMFWKVFIIHLLQFMVCLYGKSTVSSTVCSGLQSRIKKTSNLRITAIGREIHRWSVREW